MVNSLSRRVTRSRASGVGRNIQVIGRLNPVAAIQRRRLRSSSERLTHRAGREYGSGTMSGE